MFEIIIAHISLLRRVNFCEQDRTNRYFKLTAWNNFTASLWIISFVVHDTQTTAVDGAVFHMNSTFHIETNYVMLCEYLSSQKLQNVPVDVSWNCVLGCCRASLMEMEATTTTAAAAQRPLEFNPMWVCKYPCFFFCSFFQLNHWMRVTKFNQ